MLDLIMPHIHVKHGEHDRVVNTDQIVTVLYSYVAPDVGKPKRPRVDIVFTEQALTLFNDNADEFWAKYQRLCVAHPRPEVG